MTQGWIEKAASHLLPSGAPLDKFARGEIDPSSITDSGHGIYIRDITGKECISGASGAVNVNIGYSRKELAEAAYEQMIKLGNGGFTPGGSTAPIEYAYQLAKFTPYNLKRFMFVHSGSEANDSGYKIARFYWSGKGKEKKYKIISRELAYHGLTIGSMYATRSKAFWNKFGPPLPGYVSIPEVYCYHCPFKKTYPGCSLECAEALATTIEKEGADTVAAFVGEPIYGVAGTIMPPPEYWPRIREICTKYEVLLIDDEVMTGFGRTGKNFACEHWNMKPDIMLMSKGITSATLPLAAIAVSDDLFKGMEGSFVHFHSTGGHPVCCAVATKNLEIMIKEKLVENSAKLGKHLLDRLMEMNDSPHVADIQGLGLFAGFEIIKDKSTKTRYDMTSDVIRKYVEACRKRGLIIRSSASTGRIQIGPPLIVTKEDVDTIVNILKAALSDVNLS